MGWFLPFVGMSFAYGLMTWNYIRVRKLWRAEVDRNNRILYWVTRFDDG